jgi:hypothetical protein
MQRLAGAHTDQLSGTPRDFDSGGRASNTRNSILTFNSFENTPPKKPSRQYHDEDESTEPHSDSDEIGFVARDIYRQDRNCKREAARNRMHKHRLRANSKRTNGKRDDDEYDDDEYDDDRADNDNTEGDNTEGNSLIVYDGNRHNEDNEDDDDDNYDDDDYANDDGNLKKKGTRQINSTDIGAKRIRLNSHPYEREAASPTATNAQTAQPPAITPAVTATGQANVPQAPSTATANTATAPEHANVPPSTIERTREQASNDAEMPTDATTPPTETHDSTHIPRDTTEGDDDADMEDHQDRRTNVGNHLLSEPSPAKGDRVESVVMKSISSKVEFTSLRKVLAPQPDELHKSIFDAAASMLALSKEITMRETKLHKFDERVPSLDLATGQTRTNAEGVTLTTTFLPHALRKQKIPAAASAVINEDRRVNDKLEEAEAILNEYKASMSQKMKEIAGLEVKIRQEKLATDFLGHCRFFSEALTIYHSLCNDGADDIPARHTEILKHEVALYTIDCLDDETISALYLIDNETATKSYKRIFPTARAHGANWTSDVGDLVETISSKLLKLLAGMSTSLFKNAKQREQTRVNKSALLLFLEKEKATKATEDLSAALDQSQAMPERVMEDVIGKIARKNVSKEMAKAKAALRKKSTGEVNQSLTSKPDREDGPTSRNNSRRQDGKPLPQPSSQQLKTLDPTSDAISQDGDQLKLKKKQKQKKKKARVSFQEQHDVTPPVNPRTTFKTTTKPTTPSKGVRAPPGIHGGRGGRGGSQANSGRGRGLKR